VWTGELCSGWSVVVEYDGENQADDGVADVPMVTRKRSNTMPGTFRVAADDLTHDDSHTDDDDDGLSLTHARTHAHTLRVCDNLPWDDDSHTDNDDGLSHSHKMISLNSSCNFKLPLVFQRRWLGVRKSIQHVKIE